MYTRPVRTNKMSQKLRDVLHYPPAREARTETTKLFLFFTPEADSDPQKANGEKTPHFSTKTTNSVSLHEGHPVEADVNRLSVSPTPCY